LRSLPAAIRSAAADHSGQTLGTVTDVVQAKSGHRGYLVVAGKQSTGTATPVPYQLANSMTKNGIIVLDRGAFEQAPKVAQSQLSGRSSSRWQRKVDQYWNKHSE
jgi:hypothetical protein